MYLGHFAVGLAARPAAPKVSLGILLVATQVLDILYGVFLLFNIGRPGGAGPWDHSLLMTVIWSVMAFLISWIFYRKIGPSIMIGFLVLSHWIADFISWDQVLPLSFSKQPLLGLGLYNSLGAMIICDFGLFAAGITIYLRSTKANDRIGKWAFWLLVAYIIALMPACALPGKLIIITSFLMILIAPLGTWSDRRRSLILPEKNGLPMS
ncbi:MAG TPA: hypothetical protein VHY08_07460 [Bacillota bacterium]|nr:hypothetical protein [Bacillota bacterium]